MNHSWQSQRKKNWQWRTIIWSSLLLIFGKDLGHWAYHAFAIDQAYNTTVTFANRAGFPIANNENKETLYPKSEDLIISQLILDVKNDTVNEYTVAVKTQSSHVNYIGHLFSAGETKRFVIRPDLNSTDKETGRGDILFSSAPISGSANTTCQEVHTFNFDLRYANDIKQPLTINLSSIGSKMDCNSNNIMAKE